MHLMFNMKFKTLRTLTIPQGLKELKLTHFYSLKRQLTLCNQNLKSTFIMFNFCIVLFYIPSWLSASFFSAQMETKSRDYPFKEKSFYIIF